MKEKKQKSYSANKNAIKMTRMMTLDVHNDRRQSRVLVGSFPPPPSTKKKKNKKQAIVIITTTQLIEIGQKNTHTHTHTRTHTAQTTTNNNKQQQTTVQFFHQLIY